MQTAHAIGWWYRQSAHSRGPVWWQAHIHRLLWRGWGWRRALCSIGSPRPWHHIASSQWAEVGPTTAAYARLNSDSGPALRLCANGSVQEPECLNSRRIQRGTAVHGRDVAHQPPSRVRADGAAYGGGDPAVDIAGQRRCSSRLRGWRRMECLRAAAEGSATRARRERAGGGAGSTCIGAGRSPPKGFPGEGAIMRWALPAFRVSARTPQQLLRGGPASFPALPGTRLVGAMPASGTPPVRVGALPASRVACTRAGNFTHGSSYGVESIKEEGAS